MNPPPSSMDRPSAREDDVSTLNSTPRSDTFSSDDRSTPASTSMASDVDRHLHDVGVAALAAVSQYPHAVNDHSGSFLVSEIVNAVTSAGSPPDHRLLDSVSSLLPGRGYTNTQSGSQSPAGPVFAFGHGSLSGGDLNIDGMVQSSLHRTAGRQGIVIEKDSDMYYHKDMAMEYESTNMQQPSSPSSESDDEFEDFIRFYPDEEEHHNLRKQYPTQPDAEMADFDLDDFYKTINYEDIDIDLPQPLGVAVSDPMETHAAEQPEPGPHPATIIHTSSKILVLHKATFD